MGEVQVVCFDIGGVLVKIGFSWSEMLALSALPCPSHVTPATSVHSMPTFDAYQAGSIDCGQYFADLAQYLQIGQDEAKRVHLNMLMRPYAGTEQIVAKLRALGIITGCLSNTNQPHWDELTKSGRFPAVQLLDHQLASHEIDAAKPDRRAFQAFEAACGFSGKEILLFDDSAANCQAAIALGWSAVVIDPAGDTARQMDEALSRLVCEIWRNESLSPAAQAS